MIFYYILQIGLIEASPPLVLRATEFKRERRGCMYVQSHGLSQYIVVTVNHLPRSFERKQKRRRDQPAVNAGNPLPLLYLNNSFIYRVPRLISLSPSFSVCEGYIQYSSTETPASRVFAFFLIQLGSTLYPLLRIHSHHAYSIGYGGVKYP